MDGIKICACSYAFRNSKVGLCVESMEEKHMSGILHRAGAHLKGRRLGILGSEGCAGERDRKISPLGSKQ